MESMDTVSLISVGTTVAIVAATILEIELPLLHMLNPYKLYLGAAVVASSYYDLHTALVLAAILFYVLNQTETTVVSKKSVKTEEKENNEMEYDIHPMDKEDVNNTGVPGIPSEPTMEPVENPLPTQDNSAPEETATQVEKANVTDATEVNKEDLSLLTGFGGNDMAAIL